VKRATILCAAVVAVALAASPLAATTSDLSLFGSYTKPDSADNSYGGGAKLRFGFFELRGTYYSDLTYQQSNDSCPPFCANNKPRLHFVPLEAGLVYKFDQWSNGGDFAPIAPFIGGGAGYYLISEVNEDAFGHASNEWGWYGVVGTDINFSRAFGLVVEFQYRRVRGTVNGPDVGDLTFTHTSLQLGGPTGNVGIVWHF
jgi:predicted porin